MIDYTEAHEEQKGLFAALVWCSDREAVVRWTKRDGLPLVTIEVLAPESTWELLRGEAVEFSVAYHRLVETYGARVAALREAAEARLLSR